MQHILEKIGFRQVGRTLFHDWLDLKFNNKKADRSVATVSCRQRPLPVNSSPEVRHFLFFKKSGLKSSFGFQ
jgi:hypothetical protein